jgi:hypothetical protein
VCVKPPLAVLPVPYIPAKGTRYVPFGVVLLVCTVTVLIVLLDPFSVTETGLKVHVKLTGNPAHESETVPAKPFNGANVNL